MSRIMAWIGVAVSVALIILCLLTLAACKGVSQPGCPAGQHAVPVPGGFQCETY